MKTKTMILPFASAALLALMVSGNLSAAEASKARKSAPSEAGELAEEAELPKSKSRETAASAKKRPSVAKERKPEEPKPEEPKPVGVGMESDQEMYFRRLDGDSDGRVTFEEYEERRPGRKVAEEVLREDFGKLDSNRSGYCTPSEFVRARLARLTQGKEDRPVASPRSSGKAVSAKREPTQMDERKTSATKTGASKTSATKSASTKGVFAGLPSEKPESVMAGGGRLRAPKSPSGDGE